MPMRTTGKPFSIDKKRVYEAYKAVKSNAGSAGVDGQTIEQFEADLQNNLYKLWNRMRVPSRVVLEFGDAISGISRVSGQAARSIG
jgi:hypothetical protein